MEPFARISRDSRKGHSQRVDKNSSSLPEESKEEEKCAKEEGVSGITTEENYAAQARIQREKKAHSGGLSEYSSHGSRFSDFDNLGASSLGLNRIKTRSGPLSDQHSSERNWNTGGFDAKFSHFGQEQSSAGKKAEAGNGSKKQKNVSNSGLLTTVPRDSPKLGHKLPGSHEGLLSSTRSSQKESSSSVVADVSPSSWSNNFECSSSGVGRSKSQRKHQVRVPRSGFQALAAGMILIVITPLAITVKNELKAMRAAENEKNEEKGNLKQEQDVKERGQAEVAGSQPAELELARGIRSDSLQERDPALPTKKFALDWPRIRRILWERRPRGSDYTIDMFLIFVATTCGVGGGLMGIDNLGQIGAALDLQVSTFVSLISIWNFLGRVGSGFASEIALQRWHALLRARHRRRRDRAHHHRAQALFAGSIIIGLTFGAQWALMFTIISDSEIFGLRYCSTLYNVGGIASPLGSYLLSVRVAALYDREAAKDQNRHRFGAPVAGEDLARRQRWRQRLQGRSLLPRHFLHHGRRLCLGLPRGVGPYDPNVEVLPQNPS